MMVADTKRKPKENGGTMWKPTILLPSEREHMAHEYGNERREQEGYILEEETSHLLSVLKSPKALTYARSIYLLWTKPHARDTNINNAWSPLSQDLHFN